MPVFYKIDKERRLVITTASGAVNLAEGLAHQRKLVADPDFDPSYSQLLNFAEVTQVDLSAENVRQLAQANIFSPNSRRAVLVSTDLAFGMARMFEILRDSMGERGIHVFRNLDEALDWVLGKSESA